MVTSAYATSKSRRRGKRGNAPAELSAPPSGTGINCASTVEDSEAFHNFQCYSTDARSLGRLEWTLWVRPLYLLQGFLWYNVGVCDKLSCTYVVKCGGKLAHCAACHIEVLGSWFFCVVYTSLNCEPDAIVFFIHTGNLLHKSFDIPCRQTCEKLIHNVLL